MKPSEFANLVGVTKAAVFKAINRRRLVRSVRRDARGRVDIDPAVGQGEWEANRARLRGEVDGAPRLDPAPVIEPLAERAVRRLAAIVEADVAEIGRCMLALVPHLIQGATEELRDRGTGGDPADALRLGTDDEDAGLDLVAALRAIVEGGSAGGSSADQAREAGREAVRGRP